MDDTSILVLINDQRLTIYVMIRCS